MNAPQRGASWRPVTTKPLRPAARASTRSGASESDASQCAPNSPDAATEASPEANSVVLDAAGWPTLTWTSRTGWFHQVTEFFTSDDGEALRSRNPNEVVALDRMLRIAFAMASCAESSSGRGCTASYFTIARRAGEPDAVKARTAVRRTCKLLIAAGFANLITEGRWLSDIEKAAATAHHGGQQINAARTFALVSPAEMVARFGNGKTARRHATRVRRQPRPTTKPQPASTDQPRDVADSPRKPVTCGGTLSPSGIESSLSFSKKKEPNARARVRKDTSRRTASTAAPRPLAQQRLAAGIVQTGLFGLHRQFPAQPRPGAQHIGRVCKLLDDVGIDAERWTVKDIMKRLDEAAANRVLNLNIDSAIDPLRYLTWCFRRIDWTQPSPSELARAAAEKRAAERQWRLAQAALEDLVAGPPPSPERRADLVENWPSLAPTNVRRARHEHMQTSRQELRKTLLTSWRSPKPPPTNAADGSPPTSPTTTESNPITTSSTH